MKPHDTVIQVGSVTIGGGKPVVIAGPCSVETREQTVPTAIRLAKLGAEMFRGGAFKPRSSPYTFQGLGDEGLDLLREAARASRGCRSSPKRSARRFLIAVEATTDVIQIGARNMQNVPLLRKAGKSKKPVFLKRMMSATLEEFLLAAEYVMAEGNRNVILCERGIRTFSDFSRFTLDINIVPEVEAAVAPAGVRRSEPCRRSA